MFSADDERWTSTSSLSGTLVWVVLATLAGTRHAPLGVIELLFLFAPLVVVPLGLELARTMSPTRLPLVDRAVRAIQPLAALSVVAAFWWGPGPIAGVLSLPWVILCCVVAVSGVSGLRTQTSLLTVVANIARLDLGLAGAWLLLSRFGIHTVFQEPIVLLTAVHFHYSGFATSMIAAAGLTFATRSALADHLREAVALAIAILPFSVAAGFVFSPLLRAVSAIAFALAVIALALVLLLESAGFHSVTARAFVLLASVFVLVGMALAALYALGESLHREWLTIPRMASTHGWINALGFVMPALLACLSELHAYGGGLPASKLSLCGPSKKRLQRERIALPRFVARDFYDI